MTTPTRPIIHCMAAIPAPVKPSRVNWPWLIAIFAGLFAILIVVSMTVHHGQDDWHVMTSEKGVGYKIGTDDWPAGTWETAGADGSQMCEWATRSDLTNTPDTLVDEGTIGHLPKRIAVQAGEFFVSHGCQPWHYIG